MGVCLANCPPDLHQISTFAKPFSLTDVLRWKVQLEPIKMYWNFYKSFQRIKSSIIIQIIQLKPFSENNWHWKLAWDLWVSGQNGWWWRADRRERWWPSCGSCSPPASPPHGSYTLTEIFLMSFNTFFIVWTELKVSLFWPQPVQDRVWNWQIFWSELWLGNVRILTEVWRISIFNKDKYKKRSIDFIWLQKSPSLARFCFPDLKCYEHCDTKYLIDNH